MRKSTSILVFLFIFIIGTILSGCNSGEGEKKTDQKQLSIYTTIYPIQFLLEEIGGNTVAVTSVYPPGVDAHTYEPTTRDMTAIATSDAFIYFGAGMEGFTESAANALASEPVNLISLGDYPELFHGTDENHAHHDHDEHHDHDHAHDDAHDEHAHDHDDAHDEHAHDHDAHHDHDHDGDEEHKETHEKSEIEISGALPHYHSGDSVELTASFKGEQDGNWQWYSMHSEENEWEPVADHVTNQFEGEATTDGEQIKVVLTDETGEIIAESEPIEIEIDDHDGDNDPHVWIDPQRMEVMAEVIKDTLIELNPQEEKLYNENYNKLTERLQSLDESFVNTIEGKENKYIIVPHAAYGYWEERYGIEQVAISGLTTTDEPSQKYLTELIEKAQQYDLHYVLYEQNTPDKLMKIIQDQIGAEAMTIHNLSILTEEDMENGEDYFTLMEYNIQLLDKVLQ